MRQLLPQHRDLPEGALLDLYAPGPGPLLRAGFVLSTDGATAVDGGSRALQSPADQAVFHALRAVCDALVVGAGTVRAEGYGPVRPRPDGAAWRAAAGLPARPPLVVVSRTLDLPPPVLLPDTVVLTCAAAWDRAALADRVGAVVVAGDQDVDLPAAVAALHERGLTRLHCEGGPSLLTGLLRVGLVDELCLTHTPLLTGPAPGLLSEPLRATLQLRSLLDGGDGVLLARYRVRPTDETSGT